MEIGKIMIRGSHCNNVKEPMEKRVKGGHGEADEGTQGEEAKGELKV